jgi:hypothetical protein
MALDKNFESDSSVVTPPNEKNPTTILAQVLFIELV